MALICARLVVKTSIKKKFFIIYNMPGYKFYETMIEGAFFSIVCFAVIGLQKTANDFRKSAYDQLELNEKLISLLKDCQKELSQCKEAVN